LDSIVSLHEILDEKEERVKIQKNLITKYNLPLISFTLNIHGNRKNFLLAKVAFKTGIEAIICKLKQSNITYVYKHIYNNPTGSLAFIAVCSTSMYLKTIMCEIEDNHCIGRIFDIDIIDIDFKKVSRKNISHSRRCFICEEDAFSCSRNRTHSSSIVFKKIITILKQNKKNDIILNHISSVSTRSLLYEVSSSPKPGLVDRHNNGSHKDMDFFTFIDSTSKLSPYFYNCGKEGFEFTGNDLTQLFSNIRQLGIQAESDMMIATNGVNTHKGLIFSLGIICSAFGYLSGTGSLINSNSLCETSANMVSSITIEDLSKINCSNAKTNGEKLYVKHGVTGIRGEVEGGFKTVLVTSLPIFKKLYESGMNINDVCVSTLLSIMSVLSDTNILHRHDFKTLEYVKSIATKVMQTNYSSKTNWLEIISSIDRDFIEKNISPGGSADLLAVTIAIYFFTESPAIL
jgi:holo-ACP synthase / triphosphoribosyl-dephospho-CoA synthase